MVDFKTDLKKITDKLVSLKAQQDLLRTGIVKMEEEKRGEEERAINTEKARVIAQTVAEQIQKNLEFQISNIVTMALSAVFPDPYEFKAVFVPRRNQTECDLLFVKDGNEVDPMEASGGGAIDIASLALRIAIWSIKKTRAIQILDEPAKFLSRDLQDKCSAMLKEISEKLGIQLLIVSHVPEMINSADRVFQLENKKGVATVVTL
jgi:ABC-type glutathione transport system ATPase component